MKIFSSILFLALLLFSCKDSEQTLAEKSDSDSFGKMIESAVNTSIPVKADKIIDLEPLQPGPGQKIYEEKKFSYRNDIMPLLMKGGCNSGGCHGSAKGVDGFMLSLFGYDPEGDYYRIMEQIPGRRVNLAKPEKSLLLQKASGEVNHTGGEIFPPGTDEYQRILTWIREGAPADFDGVAIQSISIEDGDTVFRFPKENEKQIRVIGTYSDGSIRDITKLAVYNSNNDAMVSVSETGFLEVKKFGYTHIFARFAHLTTGIEVKIIPESELKWPEVAQHNYIDELTDKRLKELHILPSGVCSDDEFIRRVSIDITGLAPTEREYNEFINNTSANKRAELVERLIEKEEFADLWAAKWGELLRLATDTNPLGGKAMKAGWNFYEWIRNSMLEEKPWNQFAYELITSTGSNLRDPETNYYTMLPEGGHYNPLKMGEDTAQLFMGLRTQCAQCHNHPFDRWTQNDYYGFTSFFTGIKRKHGSEAREYYTFAEVNASPAKHPLDGTQMPAKFLGGDFADVKNKDPRKVLAKWLTAKDNKLFRRNMANRIWSQFFGRGIIEPVDDVRISNPASNEYLLEELGRKFAEDYNFNLKKLVRDICTSRTYQHSTRVNESNKNDGTLFSRAYLRRPRADVVFDLICQSLDYQPTFRRSSSKRAVTMFEGGSRDSFNSYFFSTFGQAKRETVCACENITDANISQALHLMNGSTVNMALERTKLFDKLMKECSSSEEVVKRLYNRILCRQPKQEELAYIFKSEPGEGSDAQKFYKNIAWALLNSSEFLFNH